MTLKIIEKLKNIKKDDKAFMSAPVILALILVTLALAMLVISGYTTIFNTQMLKEEILNQTSYFNSELAEICYNQQTQGYYDRMKQGKFFDNEKQRVFAKAATNFRSELMKNLKIKTRYNEVENPRVIANNVAVTITSIDEATHTVHYRVVLSGNVKVKNMLNFPSEYTAIKRPIRIYGSYTFNGDEDVTENKGTPAGKAENEVTTSVDKNNIGDNLPGLKQNEADDNLIH